GEARAASHVEERLHAFEVREEREAVQHVEDDHLLRLAHRGEVVHAVPLRDQLEVARERLRRVERELEAHGADPGADPLREAHAWRSRGGSAVAARRLRCTRRSEIAAGVTPWMREARPTVS